MTLLGVASPVLESFRANGFAVAPRRAPERFLSAVQALAEELVEERITEWRRDGLLTDDHADLGFGSRYLAAWRSAGRPPCRHTVYEGLFFPPALLDLGRQPWLIELVTELLGASDVAPLDNFFCRAKFPGDQRTTLPWHQDAQCLQPVAGVDFVTAWIPLDDVTEESSCLEVAPLADEVLFEPAYCDRSTYTKMRDVDADALTDVQAVRMRRGDVLLLSPFVPHRSRDNTSERIRWSVDFRYARRAG